MGIVYAARHEILGQRVALKVLRPDYASHEEVNARFLQEARTATRIESEHVARTLDVGKLASGLPYIVIELLEGKDLGDVLTEGGPLPISDVVDYVLQALEAVAEAHAIGLVHRDLKPSNLFLARRRDGSVTVKVLDFGISKAAIGDDDDEALRLTTTRQILGTPAYISPEQLRQSRDVDARADVWAIGVVLYELLTGLLPFNGTGVGSMFAAILEHTPHPLRLHRPDAPAELEAAVMKCLERSRAARWQNVADLAQALQPFGSRSSAASSERIMRVLPIIDVKVDDDPASARPGANAPATIQDPPIAPSSPGVTADAPQVGHQSTMRISDERLGSDPRIEARAVVAGRPVEPAVLSTAASWTASTPRPRRKFPLLMVFAALGSIGLALVIFSVVSRKGPDRPIAQGGQDNPSGQSSVIPAPVAAAPASAAEPAVSAANSAQPAPSSVASVASVASVPPTTTTARRLQLPLPRPSATPVVPPTKPSAAPVSRPNAGILDRN